MTSLLGGNTFNPDKDIPDLGGKTYLVTGGSSGIGFGICAHLLQHNARILLLSNKEEHADEAIDELKTWGDVRKIEWIKCDLASLKETDKVANELLEKEKNGIHGVSPSFPNHSQLNLLLCLPQRF